MSHSIRRNILFGDGVVTPGSGGSTPITPPPLTQATFGAIFKYNSGFPTKFVNSDTWYNVWADDDQIYTVHCDFQGWQGAPPSANLAISKFSNFSVGLTGTLVNAMTQFGNSNQKGPDNATWKASGLICISGVFYLFVTRMVYGSDNLPSWIQLALSSQVIRSVDHGVTWTPLPPGVAQPYASPMFPGPRFASPSFVMYGKDYQGNTIHNSNLYVYAISANGVWNNDDSLILGRCLISDMAALDATKWSFYQGGDGMVGGNWGAIGTAALLASAAGKISQTSIQYLPSLGRYVMFEWYYPNLAAQMAATSAADCIWDLYESPTPWGPWTKFQSTEWNPSGLYNPVIIQKSLLTNGGTDVMLATTGNFWNGDAATGDYTLTLVPATFSTTPTGQVHAYNVGRVGAFFNGYNLYPFIDLVKGGLFQHPTGGITFDGDEWPTIPAGGSIDYLIMATLNPSGGYFPVGDYKIKSTSALTLSPPGGTGVAAASSSGVGLVTFTYADPGSPDVGTVGLVIHIANPTAGPLHLTNLVCCLTSEEALLTSGEIFKPDFLAIHAGAFVLRMKDWMFQDELWYNLNRKVFADYGLQSETKPSFVTNNLGQGIGIPFSIMIKLCKKLGAKCWLTLPSSGGTFWTWAADGTISSVERAPYGDFPHTHRFANGTKVGLPAFSYGGALATALSPLQSMHDSALYFVVNATATTFQVSLTLGGSPIVPTNGPLPDIGATGFQTWVALDTWDRYTDLWAPMLQKCFDTDPTVHLWVEYGNEVWNGGYWNTPYCQFVDFFNSGSTDFADILDNGYAFSSLKAWATAEAIYPPASITRVFGMFTAFVTAKTLNKFTDPGIITAGKSIGQIMAATPSRSVCVVAPYMSPDINGHAFGNVTPTYLYLINGNSLSFTDSFWHSLFEGAPYPSGFGFQAAEVWMANCVAERDANAPGVPFSMYEWGHQAAFGGGDNTLTDAQKIQVFDSFKAYIDGPGGLALYQEGYARLSVPFGVEHIAHYWSAGGYVASVGGMQYWGLQNTPIDTYRSSWFRSL